MIVTINVKLEDKELNAIRDLATLNCTGIECVKCPLFIESEEHCIAHYARIMTDQLKERGIIPWRH